MQPVWLCIISCNPFEVTFDDPHQRKANQCDYASSVKETLTGHMKTHRGENLNKNKYWNYTHHVNTCYLKCPWLKKKNSDCQNQPFWKLSLFFSKIPFLLIICMRVWKNNDTWLEKWRGTGAEYNVQVLQRLSDWSAPLLPLMYSSWLCDEG